MAACATGGGTGGDDDGPETSSSTGGAGTGGVATTTGTGGTTTTTGTGGTSTGSMCEEDPCKLVAPQCGCGPGEKCQWDNDMRSCVADGTADEVSGYGGRATGFVVTRGKE